LLNFSYGIGSHVIIAPHKPDQTLKMYEEDVKE
jgi:hypothetical protein